MCIYVESLRDFQIGDKYDSRVATRMGGEYVNAMNMLLLTMRGTPITYYGEEIGMIDLNLTSVNTSDYDLFGGAAVSRQIKNGNLEKEFYFFQLGKFPRKNA